MASNLRANHAEFVDDRLRHIKDIGFHSGCITGDPASHNGGASGNRSQRSADHTASKAFGGADGDAPFAGMRNYLSRKMLDICGSYADVRLFDVFALLAFGLLLALCSLGRPQSDKFACL